MIHDFHFSTVTLGSLPPPGYKLTRIPEHLRGKRRKLQLPRGTGSGEPMAGEFQTKEECAVSLPKADSPGNCSWYQLATGSFFSCESRRCVSWLQGVQREEGTYSQRTR